MDTKLDIKMVRNKNASDTGDPGPGSSVAELPAANEGISNDEQATSPANDNDTIVVDVPLRSSITPCKVCRKRNIKKSFLNLKDLVTHLKDQHKDARIKLRCVRCSKEFPGLPNWHGHKSKCKGPADTVDKPHKCKDCNLAFDTQTGLSQHERHMHPKTRNVKRREQAEKPHAPLGRKAYVWNQEETDRLIALNERYKSARFPNKEIQKYFPDKTMKQISDKRRGLLEAQINRADHMEGDEQEGEAASTPSQQAENVMSQTHRLQEEEGVWRNKIVEHVESIEIHPDSDLFNVGVKLRDDIRDMTKSKIDLFNAIDKLIEEDLTHVLLNRSHDSDKSKRREARKRNGGRRDGSHQEEQRKRNNKSKNHNQRKKIGYARCQELYRKCPKKLAEMAISGDRSWIDSRQEPPSAKDIKEAYDSLWGVRGPQEVNIDICRDMEPPVDASILLSPITTQDIRKRLLKIKNKSAAGCDGIKKGHLMSAGTVELLTILYNVLLMEGYFPQPWKKNRTTLIPKAGKDTECVANWRPITIGSILARIFSAILDAKLRSVIIQSARQKGFANEDGCKFNIAILEAAIDEMKGVKGGVVTMLDITKAFDTIPHIMVEKGLERKGVPRHIRNLIRNMYENCTTVIKAKDNKTVDIGLRRGVKQGDPLSPLLFNLALEPMIEDIQRNKSGISLNDRSISILAFADDIALIAKDAREAQQQLNAVKSYLQNMDMSLSISKCATFQIVHKNKTWHIRNPNLTIDGQQITYVESDEAIQYLGSKISPWNTLKKGSTSKAIIETIMNTKRFYLKPYQKIDLLQTYIFPHFIYILTLYAPAKGTLQTLDTDIRTHVKEILHLPLSTASGFFYTPKKDGGLGLMKFQNVIQLAIIRNNVRMGESSDPITREISTSTRETNRIARYCRDVGIPRPENTLGVSRAKTMLKEREITRWEELRSQGHGVQYYRGDRIGNRWLATPELLKGSRYIDAIRLRTNTFGTRVVLSRTRPNIDTSCRRCHQAAETLGHILGQCIHTKTARMKRHNDIRDFIANKISKTRTTFVEPTINEFGELKKPDIVIKNDEKLQVIDITVRYEKGNYLKEAAREKVEKYKNTAELIKIKMDCVESEVLPIVVGSRGALPEDTKKMLKMLGFNQQDMMTISLIAFRSSIEMANVFIDYDT